MKTCCSQTPPISLGRYVSYWFNRTPRRILHSQSYYKFAAHLIGQDKRVLDVGCNEGLGTYLLGQECGFAKGIDFDAEAIGSAKKNFSCDHVQFEEQNILESTPTELYDAITSFDVIEHVYPEHVDLFFRAVQSLLKPDGLLIIGTPSLVSQQFASAVARTGHINIYSPERLEEEMKRYFRFVFMFAGNDELVHTGYLPLAHYLLSIGCKKI